MNKLFWLGKVNWRITVLSVLILCGVKGWAQGVPATESSTPAGAIAPFAAVDDISSSLLTPKVIEDLSTPSLQSSELIADKALIGEVDVQDGFTRELTRVAWRPGDPVNLYIIKPAGVKRPPVILYLYSYPSETDRFRQNDFCRFLTRGGFAAVGFSSALTGERYHNIPMAKWFVSELPQSLAISAHDVQMILNYLATRGDFNVDQIGMFGDGSGATIAILAAAVDPRIKTLDLLDPWGDWPDWIAKSTLIPENERPDYLKPEFLKSVAPLDPVKWLPQLKTQKVLLEDVKTVTVTPDEARNKIEAAVPSNVEIQRYDNVQAFAKTASSGKEIEWLKEQLQSEVPGQFRANDASQSHHPSSGATFSQP
jgi:hypothetical protein